MCLFETLQFIGVTSETGRLYGGWAHHWWLSVIIKVSEVVVSCSKQPFPQKSTWRARVMMDVCPFTQDKHPSLHFFMKLTDKWIKKIYIYPTSSLSIHIYICVCVCVYLYTHTHTHTEEFGINIYYNAIIYTLYYIYTYVYSIYIIYMYV